MPNTYKPKSAQDAFARNTVTHLGWYVGLGMADVKPSMVEGPSFCVVKPSSYLDNWRVFHSTLQSYPSKFQFPATV